MSGILDNKTRIMDTIVTLEGRRQMADGKLRIEYVSFTDSTTFYDPDVVSGSSDVTTRLYFEQCHLPQDQITFEADDSGKLKPFKNVQGIATAPSGKIYTNYSSSINFDYLTGSQFASTAGSLLNSSINNFKNLQKCPKSQGLIWLNYCERIRLCGIQRNLFYHQDTYFS